MTPPIESPLRIPLAAEMLLAIGLFMAIAVLVLVMGSVVHG
jgi:hypothetical protein